MPDDLLEFRAVGLRRGSRTLLSDISLSLDLAGTTVVMGANGAGKSLFLSLAHGVVAPSAGQVLWSGRPAAETRRARAIMFQATPILRRSVAANVAFPLLVTRTDADRRRQLVAEALDKARLTARAGQPAARLSGGERQRMALARALVSRPQAVLMDEPAANLDPASTRALEEVIKTIVAEGVSVILASHDIGQARRLADQVVFMADGQIIEAGPARELLQSPQSPHMKRYFSGEI